MIDSEYVAHMISHHNTALELSELIIVSTKNSQILTLEQLIILDQSKEIFELDVNKVLLSPPIIFKKNH